MSKPAKISSKLLDDYCFYSSGTEVPINYSRFSILVTAGALLGAKVWVQQPYDHLTFEPNLYAALIGPQGSRKSSAAGLALSILQEIEADHPFTKSVFTKEALIKRLSAPDAKASITRNGKTVVYEPLSIFIFELKNTLALNANALVDWLTACYDGKGGSGSETIKRGNEDVEKPLFNLLACETTDWVIQKFREHVLSGGIARRLLFVVEEDYPKPIADPRPPPGAAEAMARVKKRLEGLLDLQGPVTLSQEAKEWYCHWYENKKPPGGKFAAAWYSSKHIQLLKIATILAAADDRTLKLGTKHLKTALALIDEIEPRMLTLIAMSGRNPLLAPCYTLLSELKQGPLPDSAVRTLLFQFATPRESDELLQFMLRTKQIKQLAKIRGEPGFALRNGEVHFEESELP